MFAREQIKAKHPLSTLVSWAVKTALCRSLALVLLIFFAACKDGPVNIATPISSAAATIAAPGPNKQPEKTAKSSGNFTVASVSWSPDDYTFEVYKTYTVTVTLEADYDYFFTDNLSAAINEQSAQISGGGSTVTLSYQFPEIPDLENEGCNGITIPFKVYDVGTLKRVGTDLDALAWSLSADYEQIADIVLPPVDAGESNWTAIGYYRSSTEGAFRGAYDGKGHTISNLTINDGDNKHQGMFAYIANGAVKNVGLINSSIKGNGKSGGVAGEIGNGGNVQNCYFTGSVTGGNYSGSIAGDITTNSIIQNCHSTGSVSGNSFSTTGGIAGANSGTVQNCVALNISVTSGSTENSVGRVAGENTISQGGTLANNYARSDMILKYGSYGDDKIPVSSAVGVDGKSIDATDYNSENWWKDEANWKTDGGAFAWDFVNVWTWDSVQGLPALRKK